MKPEDAEKIKCDRPLVAVSRMDMDELARVIKEVVS